MSQDSKRIAAVVVGVLTAFGLAIAAGAVLVRGHGSHLLNYQGAIEPTHPDPTFFATVVGKVTPGLDLSKLLTPNPQALARGKKLFSASCMPCHGATGKGNGPAAAALHPAPRNLTVQQGWTRGYTLAELYITLSEGIEGTAMPSFDTLSPADRFALAHFIQSLGKFDHRDDPTEETKQLDAKYHLSESHHAPNKVAVSIVMKHMAAEFAAPPAVRIPDTSDTSVGAALCRKLIADPVRAAEVLSKDSEWRTNLDVFARATMAGTPQNGFRPMVAELDQDQWRAFHDTLAAQTPLAGAEKSLGR